MSRVGGEGEVRGNRLDYLEGYVRRMRQAPARPEHGDVPRATCRSPGYCERGLGHPVGGEAYAGGADVPCAACG